MEKLVSLQDLNARACETLCPKKLVDIDNLAEHMKQTVDANEDMIKYYE